MKKSFRIILIVVMLLAVVFTLWACNDDDDVVKSLSAPENVASIGSTISWNAVSGASSYEIILPGATEGVSTTNTYYNLDITQIGTYLVKIRAVGTNTLGETIYSAYTEYTFNKSQKLSTPQVAVAGKTVSWGVVSNAQSYLVKILNSEGSVIHEVSQTELSLELTDEKFSTVGKYTIQVKAIPEDSKPEYANSDAGINYYVVSTTLATPAISNVSTTSIRWTSISGISSYRVYLYKVGQDKALATYTTTSNSYAFSNMNVDEDEDGEVDYCITEKEGTYYCLLEAVGDGEVYKNSPISERDTSRDLKVISSLTGDIVLEKTLAGSWVLKFVSKNPDQLASFTVSLKTTKADDSASMPAVESSVFITDTELTYVVASGEFDAQKIYYDEKPAGYVKNLAEKKAGTTYYKFELDTATDTYKYVEYSGTLSSFEDYYIKHDAIYYEQAKGAVTYKEVAQDEAFSTRYNYYIKDGDYYKLVESKYLAGTYSQLSDDDSIIYMVDNGDNTFAKMGKKSELDSTDTTTVYWAYKPFSDFEDGVTYYKATYADITATEYAPGAYYVAETKEFTQNIDDLFFTVNGEDYTYKKSDIAYYGKTYTITVTPKGAKDTTLPGSAITCDDNYVSYRKPTKITSGDYTGYYAIESLGDLQYIQYEPSANYVQMKDLDAEGYVWTPISMFRGIYDGNNHMISNIVYGRDEFSGLFGACSAAQIKNVYIVNASNVSNPKGTVGGIVGGVSGVFTIENCYVKGSFSDANTIGGIVGGYQYADPSDTAIIKNCQADVTIKNTASAGGIIYGVIAAQANAVQIEGCIATGSITSNDPYFKIGDFDALDKSGTTYGIKDSDYIYKYENSTYVKLGAFVDRATDAFKDDDGNYYSAYYYRIMDIGAEPNRFGGIAGGAVYTNIGYSSSNVKIDVSAIDLDINAGGFVGEAINSQIFFSYAGAKYTRETQDMITITSSGSEASCTGGFVGKASALNVANCYTTIKTFGRDNFGGFIGYLDGTGSLVTRCYSAGGISDQSSTSKGLFVGKAENVTEGTFVSNYVYLASETLPTISYAVCYNSFDDLYNALNNPAGSVAKISDYKEPALLENIYTSAYTDKIKASGVLNVKTYIAKSNAGTVEVIDMFENKEKAEEIIIGDKTAKGTVLWVLKEVGASGRRVVIYVTVS